MKLRNSSFAERSMVVPQMGQTTGEDQTGLLGKCVLLQEAAGEIYKDVGYLKRGLKNMQRKRITKKWVGKTMVYKKHIMSLWASAVSDVLCVCVRVCVSIYVASVVID